MLNLFLITTTIALFVNFAGFLANAFEANRMEGSEQTNPMKKALVTKTLLTWGVTILILSLLLGVLLYIKYVVL